LTKFDQATDELWTAAIRLVAQWDQAARRPAREACFECAAKCSEVGRGNTQRARDILASEPIA
jgi:hypothetical protein